MARWRESLRFHLPLIEPDVRISRIRLSEKVHAFACGIALRQCFGLGMQCRPRLLKAFVGGSRLASLSFGSLVASCADPSTSAPSLGGRYPLHRYYGPIRLPSRPDLTRAGVQLAAAAARMGLPCCVIFLADVPSPLPRRTRRTGLFGAFDGPLHATAATFPHYPRGRRPRDLFRGLLGVHTCYGPSAC